jgi:uncharacterized protein YjbJ (UPF0337 family)
MTTFRAGTGSEKFHPPTRRAAKRSGAMGGTICMREVLSRRFPTTTAKETAMNWDRVEGNWKTFKGQVQQQWGKLTNDDLDVIEGKRTELSGRLQERYGYAKDEAEKNIDAWLKSVNN